METAISVAASALKSGRYDHLKLSQIAKEIGVGRRSVMHAEAILRGRRPPRPSIFSIYFIRVGTDGPIKIGKALSVKDRLSQLQSGNPRQLVLLAVMPNSGSKAEMALHRRFKQHRIRGEWFDATPDLLELIDRYKV